MTDSRYPETIRPQKRLGQNFLRDPNTARKIVGSLTAPTGARVVEIGPGTGALTGHLLERFPDLVALEIDPRAAELLRTTYPTLDVRQADVLDTDWNALAAESDRPLYVIGNLPYYITTPILFGLIDSGAPIAEAVVMMQREVARRLVAQPSTKAYGILSVVLQRSAPAKLLFDVSRNVFYPKPNVTSAVVRLDFAAAPVSDVDPMWLRKVVRTAFNQRRKTLRNSLGRLVSSVPAPWSDLRADALSPDDFVALARYLATFSKQES